MAVFLPESTPISDKNGHISRDWYIPLQQLASALGLQPLTFDELPATPPQGTIRTITDSTTVTWGAAVTIGGGLNIVLIWWNGSDWTVVGK